MKIHHIISVIVLGCLVSFYIFPIGFAGLPESLNTKQVMAVLGVLIFALQSFRDRSLVLGKPIVTSALFAGLFSLWCYLCVIVNNTDDYAYASYIRSFAIWLSGAYCLVTIVKAVYGDVSISLITKYLLFVCVVQCVLAHMIDNIPSLKSIIDTYILQDKTPIRVDRLYGIGASLDSAGVRFATTLVLTAYVLINDELMSSNRKAFALYILLFLLLSVLGATIARTTLLGTALGFSYLAYSYGKVRYSTLSVRQLRFWTITAVILGTVVVVATYAYLSNPNVRYYLRFAFESFFNFFEKGEFSTGSSDVLMNMWLWPTDSHGWWLGYGHFDGWYYNTDIGYCRFTLYCGLIGMVFFSLFFIVNAYIVSDKYRDGRLLALLLLAIVFVVWVKVSTDIFQFFALLLLISSDYELTQECDLQEEE